MKQFTDFKKLHKIKIKDFDLKNIKKKYVN